MVFRNTEDLQVVLIDIDHTIQFESGHRLRSTVDPSLVQHHREGDMQHGRMFSNYSNMMIIGSRLNWP